MGFLVGFFLKNGIHSRRTIWMAILSLIPVGCSLILWLIRSILEGEGVALVSLYPQMSFFLFLHFLLPLMSVFIGAAVIADEVEERTLPYLITRPLPRRNIVLTKLISGALTVAIILFVSLALTYTIMMLSEGVRGWTSNLTTLLQSMGVLVLGILVYLPLFGLLGGILKRPVLAGLLFIFGWESTVGMFPGNAKLFTVVHYLHVLFPRMQQIRLRDAQSALLDMVLPAKQIAPITAILILILMSAIFVGLLSALLYIKEYRLEQS